MSRANLLLAIDRGPRYASLLGLLGLIGVAGVFDPELYRFSSLSFLSYVSFFRFFRSFFDPSYGPTVASAPFLVLAIVVGAIYPWLSSSSPMFGFAGFAGCCGLYDPPGNATRNRHQIGKSAVFHWPPIRGCEERHPHVGGNVHLLSAQAVLSACCCCPEKSRPRSKDLLTIAIVSGRL